MALRDLVNKVANAVQQTTHNVGVGLDVVRDTIVNQLTNPQSGFNRGAQAIHNSFDATNPQSVAADPVRNIVLPVGTGLAGLGQVVYSPAEALGRVIGDLIQHRKANFGQEMQKAIAAPILTEQLPGYWGEASRSAVQHPVATGLISGATLAAPMISAAGGGALAMAPAASRLQAFGQGAIKGAIPGGIYGGTRAAFADKSPGEIAKQSAIGAGIGALLSGGVDVLKYNAAQSAAQRAAQQRAIQEIVQNPEIQQGPTEQDVRNQADKAIQNIKIKTPKSEEQILQDLEQSSRDLENLPTTKAPPKIDVTAETQLNAETESALNMDEMERSYRQLANTRGDAAKVAALQVKRQFQDFNDVPLQDVAHQIEAGDDTGRLADVRNYLDDLYAQERAAGVPVGYEDNYFPHTRIWEEKPDVVQQKMSSFLQLNPGFSKNRTFDTIDQGLASGLHLREDLTLGDVLAMREYASQRAIADATFFNTAAENGWISPESEAPKGWVELRNFPGLRSQYETGGHIVRSSERYYAPPELADKLNNLFEGPRFQPLQTIANVSSTIKNVALEGGVPGTGLNYHGMANVMPRVLETDPTRAPQALAFLTDTGAGKDYFESHLDDAYNLTSHGMTAGAEGVNLSSEEPTGIQSTKAFMDRMFTRSIPAIKVMVGRDVYESNIAAGMSEDEAWTDAAHKMNATFGGINWKELGRSADTQALLRIMSFTPDWLESNYQMGKGIVGAIANPTDPRNAFWVKSMGRIVAGYVAANAVNYKTTGHFMFQNDPGHQFEVALGHTGDGKVRYWRPFGGSIDFIRVPYEIFDDVRRGDFDTAMKTVTNRVGSLFQLFGRVASGEDVYGNKIFRGEDKYGRDLPPSKVALNLLSVLPITSYGKAIVDTAQGRVTSPEQFAQEALELPLRYGGGATTDKQRLYVKQLQDAGKSGEQISNALKIVKSAKSSSTKDKAVALQSDDINQIADAWGVNDVASMSEDNPIEVKAKQQKIKSLSKSIYADPDLTDWQKRQLVKRLGATSDAAGYDIATISAMPEDTAIQRGEKSTAVDKAAKAVYLDDTLTPDQKTRYYAALGANPQEVEYHVAAGLSAEARAQYTAERLGQAQDLKGELLNLTDNKVLTADSVEEMYSQGLISGDTATLLHKFVSNIKKGRVRISRKSVKTVRVGGGRTSPKAPSLKMSPTPLPNIKLPKTSIRVARTPSFKIDSKMRTA